MSTVGLVARRDLLRRWRRVAVVAVLVGVVGAFTLAVVAGARRTSTALERFQRDSRSADVELAASPTEAQLAELSHAPGVAAMGVLRAYGLVIPVAPDFQSIGAPTDDHFGEDVDRDRLVAGRAPDPDAPDEATIGEGLAARLGLAVGDRLDVESFTPAQIEAILGGEPDVGARAGPVIPLRIVGIVRRPLDLGEQTASGGLMVLSPGFAREYGDQVGAFGSRIRLRTEHGLADVPEVVAASKRILGDSLFVAQGLAVDTQGARNAIDVLSLALWIAAAVAAVAGLVTIAIVLTREISLVSVDLETLRELGCDRRQLAAVAAIPGLIVAGSGALMAAVLAVLASPLFPLGVARRADPDVGLHADWVVLGLGVLAVTLVVVAVAVVIARRATGAAARDLARGGRTSVVADRVAAAGAALPVVSGVRMALERGRGRTSVPVRTAIAGAVVGVLGVTVVVVFGASLDRLSSTPARYGSPWDMKTGDITSNTPCGAQDFGLSDLAGVSALAEICTQNVQIDGRLVGGFAFRQLRGAPIRAAVTTGRPPEGDQEVALGAKTLRALGKHVGDEVRIAGREASGDYRVVGVAVLPTVGPAQPLADGVVFTGDGYAPLFDQNLFNRTFVVRLAPGVDRAGLERRIDAIPQLSTATGPVVPVEVDRLHSVDWLPATLALLLGGLGLLAVGHALVTGVRRRRRDLALMKTLGFDRRQLRATVAWQATTLGLAGLVTGIPAGAAIGVLTWRAVAAGLGVAATATVPVPALLATAIVVILLVNLIAFLPARAAANGRPGLALRAE